MLKMVVHATCYGTPHQVVQIQRGFKINLLLITTTQLQSMSFFPKKNFDTKSYRSSLPQNLTKCLYECN